VREVAALAPAASVLDEAAAALRGGGVVAFPTETFYGLGVAALDPAAVRRVLALKGRAPGKPVLVLVDSVAMAETIAVIPPLARAFMDRHWPGALTLVLPARRAVPTEVTAGTGTVGVRLSPHLVATGLVAALGAPVTAPSANPEGAAPPRTAAVLAYFPAGLDLVLDGGATRGGEPSTVVDMTADPPWIVRQGAVRVL
jgi:L-threonylcarbamoyladenylate synthase